MLVILRFLADNAFLVYLFLAVGVLVAARRLWEGRGELRSARYGLEIELARRRLHKAVALLALTGAFALAEAVLLVFLVPNLPASSLLGTPTLDLLATPVGTLPPAALETLGIATPAPSATPASSGCIPGQIMITSPQPGADLRGLVVLEGTADIPNFGFFKYEFALLGSENWTTIQADRRPKQDESLGRWDTTEITPGEYALRLVVTDNQGNLLPPCVVPVRILAP